MRCTSSRSSRWRRSRWRTTTALGAACVLRTEAGGRRWRRSFCGSLILLSLRRCGSLVLLQIALDEARMFFNLIFCDAHLQQVLQDSLHSRVCQIDIASCSASVRSSSTGRRSTVRVDIHSSRGNDALRLRLRSTVLVTRKQPSKSAVLLASDLLWLRLLISCLCRTTCKWPCFGILMRILLSLVHLLLELFRLFLIRKAQPRQTIL